MAKYWYGAVGCELCPCGKNPEWHTITDHQVDERYRVTGRTSKQTTALQGDWQD